MTGLPSVGRVPVRSLVVPRRQAEMLGAVTPNRASRNRSWEVWSKVSWQTQPPTLNGETTSIGTRKPRPIGPATPLASLGRGLPVRYSPAVPGGATGGATWSKKPSFSSQLMNSTVLAQTAGFDTSVFDDLLDVPLAQLRGSRWVLVVADGWDDPGHRRQLAGRHVLGEVIGAVGTAVAAGHIRARRR